MENIVAVTVCVVLALGVGLYFYPISSLVALGGGFFIVAMLCRDKKGIISGGFVKILASCYFIPLIIIFLCKVFSKTNEDTVAVILSGVISYAIAIPLALWLCCKHFEYLEKKEQEQKEQEARKCAEVLRKYKAEERKREEEERKRRREEVEAELKKNIAHYGYWQFIRLGKPVEKKADNLYILKIIAKGHFILDTCVWMAEEELDCFYEDLFYALKENGGKITISADILDELSRLKTDSNSKKRAGARRGLTRIEKFQNDGLIKTCGVKKVANPNAYADKSIIDFFMKSDNSTLLTFDKELRIRLTAKLEEQNLTTTRQILNIKPTKYNKHFQSEE